MDSNFKLNQLYLFSDLTIAKVVNEHYSYPTFKETRRGKQFAVGIHSRTSICTELFFKIEDKSWGGFIKKKEIIFPKAFVAHMAMITVGTSRGILHSKTEGTPYNELILPTLNVADMIPEDIKFDI